MENKIISTIRANELLILKDNGYMRTKYSKLAHEILGQLDAACPGMIPTFLITKNAEKELFAMRKSMTASITG